MNICMDVCIISMDLWIKSARDWVMSPKRPVHVTMNCPPPVVCTKTPDDRKKLLSVGCVLQATAAGPYFVAVK